MRACVLGADKTSAEYEDDGEKGEGWKEDYQDSRGRVDMPC